MSKNYITDLELANEALRRAQEDPVWNELVKTTPLEHCGPSYFVKTEAPHPLVRHNFDAVGYVVFGGNEGIVGHVYMIPDPRPQFFPSGEFVSFKTLSSSKQDYLNMQQLAGLVAYHANVVIEDNIHRFD